MNKPWDVQNVQDFYPQTAFPNHLEHLENQGRSNPYDCELGLV